MAEVVGGADAVVFAAGAGPGSGVERKQTVDRGAAVAARGAAEAGVRRYLMVSSMGADDPAPGPGVAAYLGPRGGRRDRRARPRLDRRAPGRADGRTRHGPGAAVRGHAGRGSVPRDDVAAVLLALLDAPATVRATFELLAGRDADRAGAGSALDPMAGRPVGLTAGVEGRTLLAGVCLAGGVGSG